LLATTQPASSITVSDTAWPGGSWSTAATGGATSSLALATPMLTNASAIATEMARIAGYACVRMGRFLGMGIARWKGNQWPATATGSWIQMFVINRVRKRGSAPRRTARGPFELLDAAFDLIQPLVCLLRGLIGRFGTLRSALHLRIKLVQARVDPCKLLFVGCTGRKTPGYENRHTKPACHHQLLFGQKHSTPSFVWGVWNIAAFFAQPATCFQLTLAYIDAP
jgi:hypothetical protein